MRQAELLANLAFSVGVPVLGLLVVVVLCAPGVALAYAPGLLLLTIAKCARFRQGIFTSFGPAGMPPVARRCYKLGYLLLAIPAALNLAIVLLFRLVG